MLKFFLVAVKIVDTAETSRITWELYSGSYKYITYTKDDGINLGVIDKILSAPPEGQAETGSEGRKNGEEINVVGVLCSCSHSICSFPSGQTASLPSVIS